MQVVAGSEPGLLYVVEQEGTVRVPPGLGARPGAAAGHHVRGDRRRRAGVATLALHPGFPDDPRFYVHYSNLDGDTRVAEYRAAEGGAERMRELLAVDQPYENHNGGQLAFGPDGLLYLGLGDGGAAFDPEGRSQDTGTRLGKLLRLDVDVTGTDWEIVANASEPMALLFDRQTGDLWIRGDYYDRWEEVDFVAAGTEWPLNFGWDVYEGDEQVENDEPAGRASSSGRSPSTPTTSAARSPAASSTATAPTCLPCGAATSTATTAPG